MGTATSIKTTIKTTITMKNTATATMMKTRPSEANDASFSDFFIFHFFATFSFFHSPRPLFLLVSPSSSFLLPPRPSFLLIQHCLNHLESVKVHFSSISTRALPTDGRTDQPTDRR